MECTRQLRSHTCKQARVFSHTNTNAHTHTHRCKKALAELAHFLYTKGTVKPLFRVAFTLSRQAPPCTCKTDFLFLLRTSHLLVFTCTFHNVLHASFMTCLYTVFTRNFPNVFTCILHNMRTRIFHNVYTRTFHTPNAGSPNSSFSAAGMTS